MKKSTLNRTKETSIDVFRNIKDQTYLSIFGHGITRLIDNSKKSTPVLVPKIFDIWWDITKNPLRTQSYYKFNKNDMHLLYDYMVNVIWPRELRDYKREQEIASKNLLAVADDFYKDHQIKELRKTDKLIEKITKVMNSKYEIVSVVVKKEITIVLSAVIKF